MAKFSRIQVYQAMHDTGIVPVFYHGKLETCKEVLKACYDGGARCFEFTNRGDKAHEVFGQLIDWVRKEIPEMKMGVGSIVDAPTAALYIQLGADFIVCPIFVDDVIKVCNMRKVAVSPGCGSLTEIAKAHELGVEVVKIFPALQVGGPEFIKAVKGPMPYVSIMPTGGVSPQEENIKSWIGAGAFCVGMGSNLMVKKEDGSFDAQKITSLTASCIEAVAKYR
ncbi:MAG: bifunctional 4-hydroxy-2-oxoglutarate aldolase/2-dehydro-3-deoxy-phosphogluconate aldolase [Saprospiraceae bacterium]|nr:bifunctional 4-hydroxy-2-oxoglutarate aldolase/2-dehydro-3-deoxy-phosphogluconate aldolase [Saprospiraceae bacterium]